MTTTASGHVELHPEYVRGVHAAADKAFAELFPQNLRHDWTPFAVQNAESAEKVARAILRLLTQAQP